MERWFVRCITIWLGLLVPSLIIWGLIVRWNDAGGERFVRTWSWLADHLGFPLVFSPLTNPASRWLADGGGIKAVIGFVILLMVWGLMFAVPISLVTSWASWFGDRVNPAGSAVSSSSGYPLGAGTPSPAFNVLYFVTIPLALIWHGLRAALPVSLIVFVIVAPIRFVYLYIDIFRDKPWGFARRVESLAAAWDGHFDRFGMHPLFGGMWEHQYGQTARLLQQIYRDESYFRVFDEHKSQFGYVFKLLALDATMNALIVALVLGVVSIVVEAIGSLRGSSTP